MPKDLAITDVCFFVYTFKKCCKQASRMCDASVHLYLYARHKLLISLLCLTASYVSRMWKKELVIKYEVNLSSVRF